MFCLVPGVMSKVWWLTHANEQELLSVVGRDSVGVGDSFDIYVCCSSAFEPFSVLSAILPTLWGGCLAALADCQGMCGRWQGVGTLVAGRPGRIASHQQSRCEKSSTNERKGRTYKDCS